jgi:putative ABC transport system ATP-binding protein
MSGFTLELENATKEYVSDGGRFQALKGVNLKVRTGEFVSIMGPSGSGKSTLLHLLGCLDVPSSGEVYLDGMAISKMGSDELADARNRKIGFVFQAFNLASTLTVSKNVELPLMIGEMDEGKRTQVVAQCLAVVGLSGKHGSKPSQLSGGERQRVAIARAIANNPEMILADEPTGNLDSKSGKDVMDFLSLLWKKHGITIIIVTHEPVVAAYSERVIHIRDGRVEKETLQKPLAAKDWENINIKVKT